MNTVRRNSFLPKFVSSARRTKDFEKVDLSLDHGSERFIFRDRISHTCDLNAFDTYMNDLRTVRDVERESVSEEFWSFIRNILKKSGKPCDFEVAQQYGSTSSFQQHENVAHYSPKEAAQFYERYVDLEQINPINPLVLSEKCKVSVSSIISELLHATLIGFVSIIWAPKCDRCGSCSTVHSNLKDLPRSSVCEGCQYENEVSSADKVMVLFALNQKVLYTLQKAFGCEYSKAALDSLKAYVMCPANVNGLTRRISMGCGEEYMLHPTLPPGSYRMRCSVARTDSILKVRKASSEGEPPIRLKIPLSTIEHTNSRNPMKVLEVDHGKIHFDISTDTNSAFGFVIQNHIDDDVLKRIAEEDQDLFLTASELFHNNLYQRCFPNETILKNPHLSIEHVYLVFTDVVGSTKLYSEVGDAEALRLIQKHFKILFAEFSKQGRVVKTIGDSVMASFLSGRKAIEAVANAIFNVRRNCIKLNGQSLEIRVGIHCGSTLVVPLNGINDYFGQTVNLAARVEAASGASECLMTSCAVKHSEAMAAYKRTIARREFVSVPYRNIVFKGYTEAVNVTGFKLC